MANQQHVEIIKQGVEGWNRWRKEHLEIKPDLSNANLYGADLWGANLSDANLSGADLTGADLNTAKLKKANLRGANLKASDLTEADLEAADLTEANLIRVTLVETNLTRATLTACSIYGISAWNIKLVGAIQDSLIITRQSEPSITVDNLEVAQFIYLLLNNEKIRDVIDTITSKVVLILGRFTPDRKAILNALRDELRKLNYTPVLFDFEKPISRDFTETARTLAYLARFILADISEPSSIPQELQAIVPDIEVPVQPLLEDGQKQYSMFPDFSKYPWVFPVYIYRDQPSLIASLKGDIIEPADEKARVLAVEKAKRLKRP
jgi:hypothetical protein